MKRLSCLRRILYNALEALPNSVHTNDAYGSGLDWAMDQLNREFVPQLPHKGAEIVAKKVLQFDSIPELEYIDDAWGIEDIEKFCPELAKTPVPEGKQLFWGLNGDECRTFDTYDDMGARFEVEEAIFCAVVVAAKDEAAVEFATGNTPKQKKAAKKREKKAEEKKALNTVRAALREASHLLNEAKVVAMWREETEVRPAMES